MEGATDVRNRSITQWFNYSIAQLTNPARPSGLDGREKSYYDAMM
jgi:hypothetical protein